MSRINNTFKQLQQQQRIALIPFITAGDPKPDVTVTLMHALVAGGADIIELGVPFSDPMADGPVIQRASERALAAGTDLNQVLEMVHTFRQTNTNTPVILMGYLNPFEIMGYATFAQRAVEAGIDGVLAVDFPPEEADSVKKVLSEGGLDLIFLLSPTTDAARIQHIANVASGYLYYVSFKGVTGGQNLDVTAVKEKVQQIRQYTDLPIGVGFGIRDADSAAKVAQVANAVIVGSALVQKVETTPLTELPAVLTSMLSEMRQAMDANC